MHVLPYPDHMLMIWISWDMIGNKDQSEPGSHGLSSYTPLPNEMMHLQVCEDRQIPWTDPSQSWNTVSLNQNLYVERLVFFSD